MKTFITSELVAADAVLSAQISTLFGNAGVQAGQISTLNSALISNVNSLSNQITVANVNLKGYVDEQIATTAANASANAAAQAGEISSLWANAATQSNLISSLSTQIISANTAMRGYVDSAIFSNVSAIINGAPGALDTLNELANALGNDAIFSTTVTNTLANITSNINSLSNAFNNYSPNVQVDSYYLSAPLTSTRGGTGLAIPGTSGNVLTSNGSAWTSTTPSAIGVGQTWQDVTASRVAGTTYTNSTGNPIMVMITTYKVGNSARTNFYVGNVIIGFADGTGTNDVGIHGAASFIVPNGLTYQVTSGFELWSELR
jgi:hypothetical protein